MARPEIWAAREARGGRIPFGLRPTSNEVAGPKIDRFRGPISVLQYLVFLLKIVSSTPLREFVRWLLGRDAREIGVADPDEFPGAVRKAFHGRAHAAQNGAVKIGKRG